MGMDETAEQLLCIYLLGTNQLIMQSKEYGWEMKMMAACYDMKK
jgi:hypothetical protein